MKKFLSLILSLCLITSCTSNRKLREIKIDDLFLIKEDKYIVCFYSSTCRACLDTLELLNKRYQIKKYQGFLLKVDGLDIRFDIEKQSNLYIDNYQNVVLSTLPYLVFIEDKKIVKEVFGYTEIHKENLYIFFE